jgi:hypothetical protein
MMASRMSPMSPSVRVVTHVQTLSAPRRLKLGTTGHEFLRREAGHGFPLTGADPGKSMGLGLLARNHYRPSSPASSKVKWSHALGAQPQSRRTRSGPGSDSHTLNPRKPGSYLGWKFSGWTWLWTMTLPSSGGRAGT